MELSMKSLLLLLFIPVYLTAMGGTPADVKGFKDGREVSVTGSVRLVGSEPFSRLVVSTLNQVDLYLPDETKKDNMRYVGKQVLAKGKICIKNLETADHKYLIREIHLQNPVLKEMDSN
jgi:hypothetical protein